MAKANEENKFLTDKPDRFMEAANTFEWIIIALALAFVFRAFIMEAFRIPTGSMADTLLGAHYVLRCNECGYKYYYGQSGFRIQTDQKRMRPSRLEYSRCPSCGYYQGITEAMSSGDRILVLKCIYQFYEPRQWDVVVFKNPLDPTENYIKRLIGRPGETVEIIDGDIYINGRISRKPAKTQKELWMTVYDNDYQPVRPEESAFNGHTWRQPFNTKNSSWKIEEDSPTIFKLADTSGQENWLKYDTSAGNDFRSTYAYDEILDYRFMPYCSDLLVRFWVNFSEPNSMVGAKLSKYGISYFGKVDFDGQMKITQVIDGNEKELSKSKAINPPMINKPAKFRFVNVDHKLTLEFGNDKIIYDLGIEPNEAGERKTDIEPEVGFGGLGKMSVSHVAIFRDIYYTARNFNTNNAGRATEGYPLKLEDDQFFMLGDNSPRSEDGRWWASPGKGNNGKTYAEGIVPREYLVGKALFVYWPSGFKPFPQFPLAVIPNLGELRFIYGGSDYIN